MKQFFTRVARVISCVLLPIGGAFLVAYIRTLVEPGQSIRSVVLPLLVSAALILIPGRIITITQPAGNSPRRLLIRLFLIGAIPVMAAVLFFGLVWTHD